MSDYISKEDMRKAIKNEEREHGLKGCGWIEMAMDRLPTIDLDSVLSGLFTNLEGEQRNERKRIQSI